MFRFIKRVFALFLIGVLITHPVQAKALMDAGSAVVKTASNVFNSIGTPNGPLAPSTRKDSGVTKPTTTPVVSVDVQSFTSSSGGRPVVWQGCEAISVIVNPGSLGSSAVSLVRRSLDQVSTLSGVRFVITDANSTEVPNRDWYTHSVDGKVPPVLIAFVHRSESDLFIGGNALAGTVANPVNGSNPHLVTGAIAYDVDALSAFPDSFAKGRTRGVVVLHEIGHLIGLDHSKRDGELMSDHITDSTPATFTEKQIASLRAVRPRC